MSRTYQAIRKSGGLTALEADSSTNGALDTGRGLSAIPVNAPRDITQAVADLIHGKPLSHSFGVQGEWEVRTTLMESHYAWRYQSRVLVHGKEVGKDFPLIDGDRTRHTRPGETMS